MLGEPEWAGMESEVEVGGLVLRPLGVTRGVIIFRVVAIWLCWLREMVSLRDCEWPVIVHT